MRKLYISNIRLRWLAKQSRTRRTFTLRICLTRSRRATLRPCFLLTDRMIVITIIILIIIIVIFLIIIIMNMPHSVKESDLETMILSSYLVILLSSYPVITLSGYHLLSQQGGVNENPTRHEPAVSGSRICPDGKSRQV